MFVFSVDEHTFAMQGWFEHVFERVDTVGYTDTVHMFDTEGVGDDVPA